MLQKKLCRLSFLVLHHPKHREKVRQQIMNSIFFQGVGCNPDMRTHINGDKKSFQLQEGIFSHTDLSLAQKIPYFLGIL